MRKNLFITLTVLVGLIIQMAGCSLGGNLEELREKVAKKIQPAVYTVTFHLNGGAGAVPPSVLSNTDVYTGLSLSGTIGVFSAFFIL